MHMCVHQFTQSPNIIQLIQHRYVPKLIVQHKYIQINSSILFSFHSFNNMNHKQTNKKHTALRVMFHDVDSRFETCILQIINVNLIQP